MSKSIWDDVGREDIITAIKKFDKEKPNYHKNTKYYLLFEGNLYPSKHIRRMAYREVYPEREIPNLEGKGGKRNTVPFFIKRGFEICRKSKGTYIPEEAEDINLKEQMNLIDDDFKYSFETAIVRPMKTEIHRQSYERNPKIAKLALKNSGYKCEIDPKHITFYRKSDGKPYVEPHHIIPMA
ncbi:MAG: hypothetical protein NC429_08775, partial [Lachnospiraceae bacterium]|nr:hypothetical protein [Lachnospiraceae bacterium]